MSTPESNQICTARPDGTKAAETVPSNKSTVGDFRRTFCARQDKNAVRCVHCLPISRVVAVEFNEPSTFPSHRRVSAQRSSDRFELEFVGI